MSIDQRENAAQQKGIDSSRDDDKATSKGVITVEPLSFSSANMSTSMTGTTQIITTAITSSEPVTPTTNSYFGIVTAIPVISMSDNMSAPTPSIPPSSTPVTVQGYEKLLLNIELHINLLVTIVFQG